MLILNQFIVNRMIYIKSEIVTTNALRNDTWAQLAGKVRGISLALFWKLKKLPLFLGKNILSVFIYRLNFSVKMLLLQVFREKIPKLFPAGLFIHVL